MLPRSVSAGEIGIKVQSPANASALVAALRRSLTGEATSPAACTGAGGGTSSLGRGLVAAAPTCPTPLGQAVARDDMSAMLADLQRQYASKLAALMQEAQDQADALVRDGPPASMLGPLATDVVAKATADGGLRGGDLDAPAHPGDLGSPSTVAPADEDVTEAEDDHEYSDDCLDDDAASMASVMPAVSCTPTRTGQGHTGASGSPSAAEQQSGTSPAAGLHAAANSAVPGRSQVTVPGAPVPAAVLAVSRSAALLKPASASSAGASGPQSASKTAANKKVPAKKSGKSSKRKVEYGVQCTKTVKFGSHGEQPVRCALAIRSEVWTADWSGKLVIRDSENVERIKCEMPSKTVVWCLARVDGPTPMVWVGQERAGIPVFHAETRQLLCTLTGGHSGNVLALCVIGGDGCPVHVFSSGNDFSIRRWILEEGPGTSNGAAALPGKMQIRRGDAMHWHKNNVRSLLNIGPTLWSGGDDRAISVWRCADGERLESVEEAHEAGVLCMVIAGQGVWSSGYDGRVKEWSIGGTSRQCLREISFDEPLRALVPVGEHVWLCGQSKNIQIYSSDMTPVESLEGHDSFISSLILVDRVETQTLWSTSAGDKTLRVWCHHLRPNSMSSQELSAANKLYQEQQQGFDEKLKCAAAEGAAAKAALQAASLELGTRLEEAFVRRVDAETARDRAESDRKHALELEASARLSEKEAWEKAAAATAARLDAEEKAAADSKAAAEAAVLVKDAYDARDAAAAEAQESRAKAAELSGELDDERTRCEDLHRIVAVALQAEQECRARADELSRKFEETSTQLAEVRGALSQELSQGGALRSQLNEELDRMKAEALQMEEESAKAKARERLLELKYAELDVFKLDVIARELKNIDKHVELIRSESKGLEVSAKKFQSFADQNTGAKVASSLLDFSGKLRGTVRDIIDRCLSETQKFHIGSALQDAKAAGVLKDGGRMAGYVFAGEPDGTPPDPEGMGPRKSAAAGPRKSIAGEARQKDEVRRAARQSIAQAPGSRQP